MSLVNHFQAALNVTGPVLIVLVAGIVFKRIKLIDNHFVSVGNKLVFNVSLPCLLFLSVASSSPEQSINLPLVVFAVAATLATVACLWLVTPLIVEKSKRGVFVQCAFRGNMGIIGLALCVNAFGQGILAMAAVYLAFLTILYNVLAVLLLSDSRIGVLTNLVKNPLIIAIVAGLLWSQVRLPVPTVATLSLGYLAQLTLPLALLCIGASLEWQSFKANHRQAAMATALKLVILPLIVVLGAIAYGFRGEALGVLFLMMSAPTAAAAYIMSKQMSSHGTLAAEIITLSTALSPITVTCGLVLLGYHQML
ncbi:AEC family transporter [Teredinibacter franksiae]|uniref:AEC family transporter n=1 Tax=Teredinibacter franksiae TaxID=2761453 RepID=UPI001624A51C|nr:AEC family transporter [Teredinibacter franksiae]